MPSWNDIIEELKAEQIAQSVITDPKNIEELLLEKLRKKYVYQLSNYTKRNTIVYYSAWLQKNNLSNLDINDFDMNGFMNAVNGLDCSKGLDLVLHTPGGSPVAAESIVKYLRIKFNNDIRVIVPHLAMSAGTMIACSAKEIIMGKQSSLGPIDPQIQGIAAYNIKGEFDEAREDLQKNPQNAAYWALLIQKYPATFVKTAIDAIELSDELLRQWLKTCMFSASDEDNNIVENIVKSLNEHSNSKNHGRHFDIDTCKKMGLKITNLEDDSFLQDAVLSIHHIYSIIFSQTSAIKIIDNQNGHAYISHSNLIRS